MTDTSVIPPVGQTTPTDITNDSLGRVYSCLMFILVSAVAVAAVFPNLGPLLSLIGALSLSLVGLIFPAVIETLVYWDHPGLGPYHWRLWKNVAISLFGLVGLVTGTMTSLQEFGH